MERAPVTLIRYGSVGSVPGGGEGAYMTGAILVETSTGATTDTWAISGPAFLELYVALVGAVVVGAVLHRYRVRHAPTTGHAGRLDATTDPYLVAYLAGGHSWPCSRHSARCARPVPCARPDTVANGWATRRPQLGLPWSSPCWPRRPRRAPGPSSPGGTK